MALGARFFSFTGVIVSLIVNAGCVRSEGPGTKNVSVEKSAALISKSVSKVHLKKNEKSADEILLQDLNLSLRKSHEIFTEVWAHIWSDRMQRPMSVFSELGRSIQSHLDPATGHYLMKMNRCQNAIPRASEIEIEKSGTQITGAVFYRLGCGATSTERSEMARMTWQKSGERARAEWTFYAENMPRGAGSSLAFLKERIRCSMNLDDRSRMESLECQNLGQNRDNEMHMRFERFNYKKGSNILVLVEGKKYKLLTTPVCDEPHFCTQVKVPLVGAIDVFDDVVSEEAREIQKRIAREEELKEAQAELEKRIKEQKLAAEQQAKDLKTRAQRMQVEGERAGASAPEQAAEETTAEYEAPRSVDEDPAAAQIEPEAGVYEFNHTQPGATPEIERQATEGIIR